MMKFETLAAFVVGTALVSSAYAQLPTLEDPIDGEPIAVDEEPVEGDATIDNGDPYNPPPLVEGVPDTVTTNGYTCSWSTNSTETTLFRTCTYSAEDCFIIVTVAYREAPDSYYWVPDSTAVFDTCNGLGL